MEKTPIDYEYVRGSLRELTLDHGFILNLTDEEIDQVLDGIAAKTILGYVINDKTLFTHIVEMAEKSKSKN